MRLPAFLARLTARRTPRPSPAPRPAPMAFAAPADIERMQREFERDMQGGSDGSPRYPPRRP